MALMQVLDLSTGRLLPVTPEMLGGSTTITNPATSQPHSFAADGPMTVTLASGTEVVVVLQGVALPRSLAFNPISGSPGDTLRARFRYTVDGPWYQPPETLAITSATSDDGKLHTLDAPVYSMGVTRTAGAGTTSTVVIA